VKNKAATGEATGDFYDCGKDFTVLPAREKREILKTAKTLLKEQRKVESLLAKAECSLPCPSCACGKGRGAEEPARLPANVGGANKRRRSNVNIT
jgi:hypothetical protein